jgi:uncharacterized protein
MIFAMLLKASVNILKISWLEWLKTFDTYQEKVLFMKKEKQPIKHHYIPQFYLFYLSNFTETEDKDSQLWITDQKQCKQWKTSPSAVAYQNKLYSLENTQLIIQTLNPTTISLSIEKVA